VLLTTEQKQAREKHINTLKQKTKVFPVKGDIAVMESFANHPHGHIQMYNGTQWVSDFRQNNFWPGSAYSTNTPNYTIFKKN